MTDYEVKKIGVCVSLVLILWGVAPYLLIVAAVVALLLGGPWSVLLAVAGMWWFANRLCFGNMLP